MILSSKTLQGFFKSLILMILTSKPSQAIVKIVDFVDFDFKTITGNC